MSIELPLSSQQIEFIKASVPEQPEVRISSGELERRWTAVRKMMEDRRIDALVLFGAGYIKWFTDATQFYSVVFPHDADMTATFQASFGTDLQSPPGRRGIKRMLGWPNSGTAPFVQYYDAELIEKGLAPYADGRIGLVGPAPFSTIEHLQSRMTRAKFIDAAEPVDAIKVLKSPEEWELIMLSADMHDRAMEAAMASVEPGMRVCDVAAVAEYVVKCYGCVPGALLANAAPIGTPAPLGPKTNTHVLQPGDGFTLLVECAGPGGMFTELGRTAVLGRATDVMKEELDFSIRAQQFCNDRLKPGVLCKDVFEEYNQFMRENGRPEERRIHCHGQGYDLVERPLIRNDESMRIEDTMNITTHPMYERNGYYSWLCDNFRVGPEGVTQRIHKVPQKIFEIG